MVSCARSHAAKLGMRAQMGGAISHASVWPKLGKYARPKLDRWSCVVCIKGVKCEFAQFTLHICLVWRRFQMQKKFSRWDSL
eukprot:2340722-Prymnesium_polylepis.1